MSANVYPFIGRINLHSLCLQNNFLFCSIEYDQFYQIRLSGTVGMSVGVIEPYIRLMMERLGLLHQVIIYLNPISALFLVYGNMMNAVNCEFTCEGARVFSN